MKSTLAKKSAAPAEQTQMVTKEHFSPLEGGSGDFDQNEIQIPRLAIVHGVGDLSAKFNPGSLIFNKETILPQPVNITIFGYKKFYIQNIKFDADVRAQKFYSQDEVLNSGGNLEKGRKEDEDPNNFRPGAELFLAIELPIDLADTPGAIDFEDKFYAQSLWTLQKTAYYKNIPKINFVDRGLQIRKQSIASQQWSLKVEKQKLQTNWVYMPVLNPSGVNSPGFVDFLRAIFS